jgi:hypothetical protein
MSARSVHLSQTAEEQISELIDLLATRGDAALQRPCPGREKLGDGTVAASAMHMADNYVRIAGFLDTDPGSPAAELGRSRHRIPQLARAAGHRIGPGDGGHPADYAAEDVGPARLLDRLSIGRAALRRLADLTDEQLDAVPPASEMRFCDGKRTLDEILTSLLKHQQHQLEAVKTALT